MIESLLRWANKPVNSIGLGIFRFAFGVIMLWEVLYFYQIDFLGNFIFGPPVLFPYDFPEVHPMSEALMKVFLAGLLISTLLIASGIFFRAAIIYFFIVFSYFILLDKGIYNNHLYLIGLMSFLMIFTNADTGFSLKNRSHPKFIANWQYRVFQLQIAIVFFFGGVAKINPYWFKMHPVREILEIRAKASGVHFITSEYFEYFIMLGGLLFDLLIPFLLWHSKSRKLAIVMAVAFNIMNAWIFRDINIFPYLMSASLVLFMDQEKVYSWYSRYFTKSQLKPSKSGFTHLNRFSVYLLCLYFIVQLYLPLRHFMYKGYVDWTGEGQHFAWRMKIQHRIASEVEFAIFDMEKKVIHNIDPRNFLNGSQYSQLILHPRMIIQFAEYLQKAGRKKLNVTDAQIKCKVKVTFNGSKPTYIFNPEQDLLTNSKKHKSFSEWMTPAPPPEK